MSSTDLVYNLNGYTLRVVVSQAFTSGVMSHEVGMELLEEVNVELEVLIIYN